MATNKMSGGDILNRALQRYNVHTCFALAGTAHAHLLLSMEKNKATHPWTVISSRHESATVAAADGYALASGKLGIAMIVNEQGLPNAMGGILTAQLAGSPVLVLSTLHAPSQVEVNSGRGDDELEMVKPFVKWARSVHSIERLEEYVHAAARQALSGRPGVAVLGIPGNMEGLAAEMAEKAEINVTIPVNAGPSDEAVERAADLLAKAKQPLILLGTGAGLSGAGPAVRKLVQNYGFATMANALGRGLVPEDLVHSFSWPLAQVAARHADVVLCLGIRLTQRMGYGLAPRFAANAKFIQVDVNAEEIGRNRMPDIGVVSDARLFAEKLDAALAKRGVKNPGAPKWVNEAMTTRLARMDELGRGDTGPIHPYRIARELMEQMPEDAIYVGDGADTQNWMYAILRIRKERAFMDHYPLGSMGIGTPLALGAAAWAKEEAGNTGKPPRPVVLVSGDGSFGFYASEFNGAVMAGLKIVSIINNDGGWGTEKHGQVKNMGTHINVEFGHCDYQLIAQAYGANGVRVEKQADIAPALKRAFAADGTTVINIITDPEAGRVRKEDPRVQCIAFDDLVSSLKTHYTPDVA